ncbi:hypothetical protein AB0910_07960 [Streptomyces sp. NPDC047002]
MPLVGAAGAAAFRYTARAVVPGTTTVPAGHTVIVSPAPTTAAARL